MHQVNIGDTVRYTFRDGTTVQGVVALINDIKKEVYSKDGVYLGRTGEVGVIHRAFVNEVGTMYRHPSISGYTVVCVDNEEPFKGHYRWIGYTYSRDARWWYSDEEVEALARSGWEVHTLGK